MFKQLAIICLLLTVAFTALEAEAKTKKNKKSKKSTRTSRQYKPTKHARRSRHFGQHSSHYGSGPDLKTITTESHYTEDPSNGVTPVETKQPGL